MKIIPEQYFDSYLKQLSLDIPHALEDLEHIDLNTQSVTFYTSVAVISSSRIEGETLETDSYLKHKMQDIEYLPELTQKPNDLYEAYLFARQNELNSDNFLESHRILSRHLLPDKWRGVYRQTAMLVMEHNTGRIQYEAAPAAIVSREMDKLWDDITQLLSRNLSAEEVFYFASFIHCIFVNIHPFSDGNGRAARLLEKWFLAQKLGEKAWYIPSEKYYYDHVGEYYRNLARQGMFYEQIDYSRADKFLGMLARALQHNT